MMIRLVPDGGKDFRFAQKKEKRRTMANSNVTEQPGNRTGTPRKGGLWLRSSSIIY